MELSGSKSGLGGRRKDVELMEERVTRDRGTARGGIVLATLLLLAAFLVVANPMVADAKATRQPAPCGLIPEPFDTYNVEFKPERKSYRLGKVMKVKVAVTRPGPKDPLGQGVELPPSGQSMPVEDVTIAVTLYSGEGSVVQTQGWITDENGVANVPMKLVTYHELGFADMQAYASKVHHDDEACVHIAEEGITYKERVVKLTR